MQSLALPLVSIGLPVYNGARYLEKALDSLLAQTCSDIELIISDNASSDGTRAICEAAAAADSRVRYVRQTENIGAMGNFQFVLEQAHGAYFMWAACDDVWDVGWISCLVACLEKSPQAIACYGQLQHIDAEGQAMVHPANGATFPYQGSRLCRRLKYFLQFEGDGKANPIYAVFRRAALSDLRMRDYPYDYLIVFELLGRGSFLASSDVALYKRIHSSSEGAAPGVTSRTTRRYLQAIASLLSWRLIKGYYAGASGIEKIALALLTPAKLMYAVTLRVTRGL